MKTQACKTGAGEEKRQRCRPARGNSDATSRSAAGARRGPRVPRPRPGPRAQHRALRAAARGRPGRGSDPGPSRAAAARARSPRRAQAPRPRVRPRLPRASRPATPGSTCGRGPERGLHPGVPPAPRSGPQGRRAPGARGHPCPEGTSARPCCGPSARGSRPPRCRRCSPRRASGRTPSGPCRLLRAPSFRSNQSPQEREQKK